MHVLDYLIAEQLRDRARSHAYTRRVWVRYRAILLAQVGRTAKHIVKALGCTRRAVQQWIARYNDD